MEKLDLSKDTFKCTWKLGEKQQSPHDHKKFDPNVPRIYNNVLEAIHMSPMIRLNKVPQEAGVQCEILAKCEFLNPGGSLKDRIGARMVLDAQKQGRIKPGDTLIEATSGNTGIGLSLAAALNGYPVIITLPLKMSNEKVDVLKALGSTVIRTPNVGSVHPDSLIQKAKELQSKTPNSHILDQYTNASNALAHYDSTAEEILHQCNGKLDYIVISAGTGGTISGIARRIKEVMPNCKVIGVDPIGSDLALPGTLNVQGNPYKVEGIGYDFIPRVLDRSNVDDWIKTEDKPSFLVARQIIRQEGLLCGGSSGSTLWGAMEYAKKNNIPNDKRMVVVLADSVRNYMTKFLNKEWMIENKFIPYEDLKEKEHPLKGVSFEKLGLTPIKQYTEDLTIKDAINILSEGIFALPIIENGEMIGAVNQQKLLQISINQKLKSTDNVSKVIVKDFVKVPDSLDCEQLERLTERNNLVFIEKRDQNNKLQNLYQVTPKDILNLLRFGNFI